MKKNTIAALGAALLMGSLIACSGKDCRNGAECTVNADDDVTYTGVLPGADCLGIRYTLSLDYDKDDNCLKGDYKLIQTYIVADSTATANQADAYSSKEKGDFKVTDKDGKKYLTLVPKHPGAAADTLYFTQSSDTTLTMTNKSFEESATPGLNYTLRLVK